MRTDKQDNRKEEIEQAALELLAEYGYHGASMLKVALRSRASNETLYRWYGSKNGLLTALVNRYRNRIERRVSGLSITGRESFEALEAVGAVILEETLRADAVVLLRAVLVEQGTSESEGVLGNLMGDVADECLEPFKRSKSFKKGTIEKVIDTFKTLLMGDLLLRALCGDAETLTEEQCIRRSRTAVQKCRLIYGLQ